MSAEIFWVLVILALLIWVGIEVVQRAFNHWYTGAAREVARAVNPTEGNHADR